MLRIKTRNTGKDIILFLFFYLQLLQVPLARALPIFGYTDECMGLIGLVFGIARVSRSGKVRATRENVNLVLALFIFALTGLVGNALYQYQVLAGVLEDLYVNLKFFLNIWTGIEIALWCGIDKCRRSFLSHAKFAAAVLFFLTVLDVLFQVFPSSETRYGLRVVSLFFSLPTALASVSAFIMTVLTMFYRKSNIIYIAFSAVTMFVTLRGKALAAIAIYVILFSLVIMQRRKIKLWHIVLLGLTAILVAWEQFAFYYLELEMESARSALTITSLQILKDYFPIGTGFGTFASNVAGERYSPVYFQYGLSVIHGLTEANTSFGSDTFWPIIIGQTGAIGTVCYLIAMYILVRKVFRIRNTDRYFYMAGLFAYFYLIVSSTSESAFCNPMLMPIGFLLGWIYTKNPKTQGVNQS